MSDPIAVPDSMVILRTDLAQHSARVDAMAEKLQGYWGDVLMLQGRVEKLDEDFREFKRTVATEDKLTAAVQLLTTKIDYLGETVRPLRTAIYSVIALVMSTVIVAVLGLVILRSGTP